MAQCPSKKITAESSFTSVKVNSVFRPEIQHATADSERFLPIL